MGIPGRRERDPGLPIKLGPCSNGEYDPAPLSSIAEAAIRRAHDDCDRNARRLGLSRRQFLLSVCGAATTLLALNGCADEATRATKGRTPGGRFEIPTTATTDPAAARAALAGNEFVFDVQGHFLEYRAEPPTREARNFWMGFPQQQCGEDDPRLCYSINHFMEEVFLRSDTSMIVLSGLPIAPENSPMSASLMDEARRVGTALCRDDRVLLQAQVLPNVGDLQANLDAMHAAVEQSDIVAWKVFTNFPDLYDGSGSAWRLDDGDPALPAVGDAFVAKAVELGVPVITAHKGLSTTLGYTSNFASPVDFGAAARRASRRALRRLPLRIRSRRDRRPLRRGDPRPRRQPSHQHHARQRCRTEPEHLRGARNDVVVADESTRRGRPSHRQAAPLRRRGQRAVGLGQHLLRIASGSDPDVPNLPGQRGVPGAFRLSLTDRRDQTESARAECAALARRRPDHRALHVHT